jgi:hypothetical protein
MRLVVFFLVVLFSTGIARPDDKDVAIGLSKDGAKKKKKKKEKPPCDTNKIRRTSNDTILLMKYKKVYRNFGGLCYVLHLQQLGKIKKSSDSTYYVKMGATGDKQIRLDWQTYLYCPIGKPNGLVVLINPDGDTIQACNYFNEMKHGTMSWFQKKKGIVHQEIYENDEKKYKPKEILPQGE